MNNFLKLVNFEFNRFLKMFLILIVVTIIAQISSVLIIAKTYMTQADIAMYSEGMSQTTFLNQFGTISFQQIGYSLLFSGPIALCIVTLIIYLFFIWYRDWLGKNTFIYRLLMLPTTRLNIYLAKVTTVFLMVIGLISLQMLLLPIEMNLFQQIVPADFREDMSVQEFINSFEILRILIPSTFTEFFIHYGIGLMCVFVLFTAILFERCFRWKGIILGIIYGILAVIIFFSPILIHENLMGNYFYPLELLILEAIASLIVIACSILTSHYLLKNKIRV